MIDVEELRIGNLVMFDGKYIKIESMNRTSVYGLPVGLDQTKIYLTSDEIEPLPLTEEILLKCGFLKGELLIENNWEYEINLRGDYILKYDYRRRWVIKNNGFQKFNDPVHIPIVQHLHQLQNLYFALTGKELTFVP